MTLTEIIETLKCQYPQTYIEIIAYDFETNTYKKKLQPKFLFRGESDLYSTTQTTYFRRLNVKEKEKRFDLNQWSQIRYAMCRLYIFLREEFQQKYCKTIIESYIVGIMQHYGFDTSFFDLCSDLDVVAHFASKSNIGNKGRIFVIPISSIIEHCYDLTQCPGDRPKKQKAFALWDFKPELGIDLKNKQFLMTYSAEWFDFKLCNKDKKFYNPDYYLLGNDSIAKNIIDWFENSDAKSKLDDIRVIAYFEKIIKELKNSI